MKTEQKRYIPLSNHPAILQETELPILAHSWCFLSFEVWELCLSTSSSCPPLRLLLDLSLYYYFYSSQLASKLLKQLYPTKIVPNVFFLQPTILWGRFPESPFECVEFWPRTFVTKVSFVNLSFFDPINNVLFSLCVDDEEGCVESDDELSRRKRKRVMRKRHHRRRGDEGNEDNNDNEDFFSSSCDYSSSSSEGADLDGKKV